MTEDGRSSESGTSGSEILFSVKSTLTRLVKWVRSGMVSNTLLIVRCVTLSRILSIVASLLFSLMI